MREYKDRIEYFREWYLKNKERILSHCQENYKKNRDKILSRNKRWALKNKDYRVIYCRKWRNKRRLARLKIRPKRIRLKDGEYGKYLGRFGGYREFIIQRDGEKCIDCGLTRKEHIKLYGVDITVDHINGKGRNSKNPDHNPNNLCTRCLKCHGKKDKRINRRLK